MTDKEIQKTVTRLKAYAECFGRKTRYTSTSIDDCNKDLCDGCTLLYAQGTVGQHLKDIKTAIEVLEQEPKTGHWIMKRRTHNEVKHYTGHDEMGEIHTISVLERYEVDEPYCSECGKRAGDTSQDYCCACGAKMIESQESEVRR